MSNWWPETNFGAIDHETDFADPFKLRLQPALGNRFIPTPHIDRRVRQKSAQASHRTFVLCIADHVSSNLTQVHRVTMINSYQQPYKILNLGDSLFWTQFTNSLNPSTIGRR